MEQRGTRPRDGDVDSANRSAKMDFELRLATLEVDLAEARSELAFLRRRVQRGWLAEKFGSKLNFEAQYEPRPLKVPSWYFETEVPTPPPRIAIVTPSFNQGGYIASTIDSVLSQSYPNLDYHVQDGGSTDATCALLERYGPDLSWTSSADKGQAHAINLGFSRSDADIMAYLNSDDTLLPGTLATVASYFARHPEIDIVYGHRVIINARGQDIGRWVLPPHDGETLKWIDFIPQETMFWRRRVWDKTGPFDETFQFALDWDFILRAQADGFRFKRLPRFLACFRLHGDQKSQTIQSTGEQESDRLRERYIGRIPTHRQIASRCKPYIRRHVLFNRLHKTRLLKY
jgi:Glycosyl transferase family 2